MNRKALEGLIESLESIESISFAGYPLSLVYHAIVSRGSPYFKVRHISMLLSITSLVERPTIDDCAKDSGEDFFIMMHCVSLIEFL